MEKLAFARNVSLILRIVQKKFDETFPEIRDTYREFHPVRGFAYWRAPSGSFADAISALFCRLDVTDRHVHENVCEDFKGVPDVGRQFVQRALPGELVSVFRGKAQKERNRIFENAVLCVDLP